MYDENNRRIRRWTVEEAQELVLREPPHDSHMSRDWSTQKAGETWDEAVRMMARHQIGEELTDDDVAAITAWLGALTGELPAAYIQAPKLPTD